MATGLDDDLSDLDSIIGDDDLDLSFSDDHASIEVDIDSNFNPIKSNNFSVLHVNVWSILAEGRLEYVTRLCNKYKLDVLVISETKLDDTIPDNLLSIHGYHEPIRRDRNRNRGGVMCYIASHLPYKQIKANQSEYFEHIWVDVITNDNRKYCINALYRPPNESAADHELFLDVAGDILDKIDDYPAYTHVLTGDLNFGNSYCKTPYLPPKPLDSEACDLFAAHGLSQLIDIPTRYALNSISLIDLIFVSRPDDVVSHGTIAGPADHEAVFVSFSTISARPKPKTVNYMITIKQI